MDQPVLFARQPIFDRKLKLFGYELLSRACPSILKLPEGGDQASSEVLLNAFTNLPIKEVVGSHKAFVNFTENLLETPPPFGKQQLVIEVLESVKPSARMISSLGQLRALGYTVALDDFVLTNETAPLLEYAQIIKLDVLALTEQELLQHVEQLRPLDVLLLAEKVEDYAMLQKCLDLEFDYFQGYFLSKPKLVKGRKANENRAVLLRLIAEVNRADVDLSSLEQIISQDPILSYKLLKLINSAAFSLVRKVTSLREALTFLGLNQVRRWTTLLSLASGTDKPEELCTTTITRARMCQVIGEHVLGEKFSNSCFTIGLFSTIDAYLDSPMQELLEDIPLTDDLKTALLEHVGPMGEIIQNVMHYERGDWKQIKWSSEIQNIPSDDELLEAYEESIAWVTSALEEVVFAA